jgi:hypothetical protein
MAFESVDMPALLFGAKRRAGFVPKAVAAQVQSASVAREGR